MKVKEGNVMEGKRARSGYGQDRVDDFRFHDQKSSLKQQHRNSDGEKKR